MLATNNSMKFALVSFAFSKSITISPFGELYSLYTNNTPKLSHTTQQAKPNRGKHLKPFFNTARIGFLLIRSVGFVDIYKRIRIKCENIRDIASSNIALARFIPHPHDHQLETKTKKTKTTLQENLVYDCGGRCANSICETLFVLVSFFFVLFFFI